MDNNIDELKAIASKDHERIRRVDRFCSLSGDLYEVDGDKYVLEKGTDRVFSYKNEQALVEDKQIIMAVHIKAIEDDEIKRARANISIILSDIAKESSNGDPVLFWILREHIGLMFEQSGKFTPEPIKKDGIDFYQVGRDSMAVPGGTDLFFVGVKDGKKYVLDSNDEVKEVDEFEHYCY